MDQRKAQLKFQYLRQHLFCDIPHFDERFSESPLRLALLPKRQLKLGIRYNTADNQKLT
ncbi:hypothetical protein D3C80_2205430 [compost metagenome]